MNTVTADQVWQSINQDPKFLVQPEPVRLAVKPFIVALPDVLSNLSDLPATYENVVKAKLAFLRYCSENGYITVAIEATPDENLGFFDRDDLKAMLENMFAKLVDQLSELIGSIPELLAEQGLTDSEVMLNPELGLNQESVNLYKNGDLTIGSLLLSQPMLIVDNT